MADGARVGTPIDVKATLTFDSPSAEVVYSPGFGPILFSLVQIGGPISMSAGGPADCRSSTMRPGETYSTAFIKSGGYEPGDPNASFYRAFFAEKDLLLPAGDWLIGAVAAVSLEDCGGVDTETTATSIRLRVLP